jgi:Co/Zn/Cd efflux system component
MESKMLLPYRWKKFGWFLLIPSLALGFAYLFKEAELLKSLSLLGDAVDEVISISLLISIILTAFSKEKQEDEWSARVRVDAMLWAVYVNTFLLLLSIVFIYGDAFWKIMILNLFTTPLLFLLRFRYTIWQSSKEISSEIDS